ncbi:hypothetical protein CDAR_183831 [Caerostris darwini]|uniref:Uncharacterized protein n=1 Tax=Caerostris darwini TaxID=1538125 RepID=A0AAV4TVT8_9ARAC|nr:hypothetical protein CDAR_183831 [Caerostris darwini]
MCSQDQSSGIEDEFIHRGGGSYAVNTAYSEEFLKISQKNSTFFQQKPFFRSESCRRAVHLISGPRVTLCNILQEVERSAKISDLTENSLAGICVGSQRVTEIFLHAISNALRNLGWGEELPFAVSRPSFHVAGVADANPLQETKRFPN